MKFEEEEFICLDDEQERERQEAEELEGPNSSGTYPINGIKVKFPFKPYPSQIGMMDRVIRALDGNKQHALLESPTGSGKTMALLCGALSWMEEQRRKHNIDYDGPSTLVPEGSSPEVVDESENLPSFFDKRIKKDIFVIEDDTDLDFVDSTNTKNTKGAKSISDCSNCENSTSKTKSKGEVGLNFEDEEKKFEMPKIYFASRTHKQLAQSIRELKRSGYQAKFTVLASRSQYCINSNVRKEPDLNEACKEALNPDAPGGRCMHSNKLQKFFETKRAFTTNMDIEDLIAFGKQRRLCPYFLAREAAQYSEIIMCPYNYLIEPMIRQAMGIDLAGAVVIIDEAHNIEDVCRSAGSFEWSQENVFAIEMEIKTFFARASEDGSIKILEPTAHQALLHVCSSVLNWMNGVSNFGSSTSAATNKYQSFETKTDIYEGQDIINELLKLGITSHTVELWSNHLSAIEEATRKMMSQKMQENSSRKGPDSLAEEKVLSSGSCRILSGFFFTLQNIFQEDNAKIEAFRLVKYSAFKMIKGEKREEIVMGFWCLSSEVIFKPIAAQARAIILTSGTLSPTDTFASELHTNFPLQLEANHVIDNSQIFVGVIPRGPQGSEMIGTFQNANSFAFQDEIGQSIYEISKVTPFGVLCFFPSYALLEKVLERMQRTGKYKDLLQIKEIVIEPRSGPAEDFEKIIKHYYKTISECKKSPTGLTTISTRSTVTGAIFFAVYRGKVSEGLDFADENARVVINVGIPYPAYKDPRVVLKKEYNDRNSKSGSLLPGMLWYETQAFRAMNQALGRCIRHRKDWGAVIFLDQRFNSQKNVQKLSKWVRPSVKSYPKFGEAIEALRLFMKSKGTTKLPEEHMSIETGANNIISINSNNSNNSKPVHDPFGSNFIKASNASKASENSEGKQPTASISSTTSISSFFKSKPGKTLGARGKRPFI